MSKSILLFLWLMSWPATQAFSADESDVRRLEDQDRDAWSTSVPAPKAPAEPVSSPAPTLKLESKIKPIEAEEFRVKLVRRSTSGRVLLLEDPSNNEPRPGKVLLLKDGDTDVLAIRVLKNRRGRFIGKIVLKLQEPTIGAEYRALKKLGDKIINEIKRRQKLDLDETIRDEDLAKEIDPNDVELDRGIPAPKKKVKKQVKETALESLEISEDEIADYAADFSKNEDSDLEPLKHALSMQIGLVANKDSDGSDTRYTSVGLRYAYSPFRKVFVNKPGVQDMISLEAGIFVYKIAGYQTATDEITVIPVLGTLRYNLLIGEFITTYVYGGILNNRVTVNSGPVNEKTELLKGNRLAAGGGLLFRIGPQWSVRGDAGLDMFAIGAVLKF